LGAVKPKVTLISHTPDPELIVATAGRRCYSPLDTETLMEKARDSDPATFITKLVQMGHVTPVEHATFTFAVEGVSRSLLAQITRHRIASFSVQSQRYVSEEAGRNPDGVFDYVIPPTIAALGEEAIREFDRQMREIQRFYDYWVKKLGGGRETFEDARFVLPNAAATKFVVTMNARELLHFFTLRMCNRAQWEIRQLAEQMLHLVKRVAPTIFTNAGPACVRGPCPEGKMSCGQSEEMRAKYGRRAGD